ncbi:hypothetical protein FRC17_001711 [Serendipita sp. 399]|nr:hypothetical protein FRC17_001711 [Serendipita sp. 399]
MTTTTVMPDFNASASYPENSVIETSPNGTTKNNTMAADKKKNSKHSSKKRTKKLSEKSRGQHRSMMMATSMGTGDWSLDVADLDFLDPVEAKKQARIAAYKRREERRAATASGGRAVGKKKRSVESFEWSIGEVDEEEQEVEQPKKEGKEVEGRVGVDDNSSDEDGSSICTDSNCSCQVDDFSALHDEGEDVTEQGQNNVQVDMNLAAVVPRDDTASSGRQTSSLDETKLVPLEMSTAIVAPVSAVHKGEQQQQQQRHVTIVDARERDLEKGAAPDGGDEEEEETEEERDLRIRVQEFKEEFRTAHPDATEEITF